MATSKTKSKPEASEPLPRTEPAHLKSVTITNIMRIRSATVTPTTQVVRLCGRNAQGKTSLLTAISALVGGAKHTPDDIITNGQKKGEVSADFGWFTASQTWTRGEDGEIKRGSVKVLLKDGTRIDSPQEFLNTLFSDIAHDPQGFVAMEPKKQLAVFKDALGLTEAFEKIDTERERLYNLRTQANAEVRIKETSLTTTPMVAGPDVETSAAALGEEFNAAIAKRDENAEKRRVFRNANETLDQIAASIKLIDDQIAALNTQRDILRKRQEGGIKATEKMAEIVAALVDPDIDAIQKRMTTIDTQNAAARQRQQHKAFQRELDAARLKVDQLTNDIKEIDEGKATLIKEAKVPVEGLTFTDDGLLLNGVPFSQASTAEQIKVSCVLVAALKPLLRLMFIKRGESCDDTTMAWLETFAKERDIDIFIERVTNGTGEGSGFIIEDGDVMADGGGK